MDEHKELNAMLRRFVEGEDRSLELAGRIEVALDEAFEDQQPYSDAALALASYRPGGGEFLHDERAMTKILQSVLSALEQQLPSEET